MIIWSFFIQFVYMVDHTEGFPCVEPTMHLQDEVYLVIVDDAFLMCSCIQFASILLSIFAPMLLKLINM